jgi:cobalt-zinc-cadmium efflux system protein
MFQLVSHEHAHPETHGRAFALGVIVNLSFVVVEAVYGLAAHSMALVADAGHNLSDVLGLALSWGAALLVSRKPSKRRTYGLKKASVLTALINGLLLVAATGAIALESIRRLHHPTAVHGPVVLVVAIVGVVVNGGSALLFVRGGKRDLNVRSAFLHLAGDAAIALGVAATGAVILYTGWNALDPVVSLVVSVLVLLSALGLLRDSLGLVMDAVPEGIDIDRVRGYLGALAGVKEVHDLHVWPMSTTEVALTAHLVMDAMPADNDLIRRVAKELHDDLGIGHATIQVETCEQAEPCHLAAEDRV